MTIENKRNNYTIWERSFVVRVRKNRLRRGRDSPDVANDTCRVREKRAQLLFFEVKKRWRESKGGGREKEREGGGIYMAWRRRQAQRPSLWRYLRGERGAISETFAHKTRDAEESRRGSFSPPFRFLSLPRRFPFVLALSKSIARILSRDPFFSRDMLSSSVIPERIVALSLFRHRTRSIRT